MSDTNEELQNGNKLALALVDHLRDMGNASSCIIPVVDRAEEHVVIVMTKKAYEHREWPIAPIP